MKKAWCLLLVILACLFWGISFVMPQYLINFTPIELALGRFFFFGILSSAILLASKRDLLYRLPSKIWLTALFFCLVMNYGYYSSLSVGLRWSNPALITLLIGISPITIALLGNWYTGEGQGKKIILPSLLIFIGLLLINLDILNEGFEVDSMEEYIVGLLCGFAALFAWTWYAVANASFLRKNPQINPKEWTSLIGMVTLFCSALGISLLILFSEQEVLEKYTFENPDFIEFLIGSAISAVCCSWIAYYLWNYASLSVPLSLMGQLAIFETIFGLMFVFAFENRFPSFYEVAGMFVILGGVLVGIKSLQSKLAS